MLLDNYTVVTFGTISLEPYKAKEFSYTDRILEELETTDIQLGFLGSEEDANACKALMWLANKKADFHHIAHTRIQAKPDTYYLVRTDIFEVSFG